MSDSDIFSDDPSDEEEKPQKRKKSISNKQSKKGKVFIEEDVDDGGMEEDRAEIEREENASKAFKESMREADVYFLN